MQKIMLSAIMVVGLASPVLAQDSELRGKYYNGLAVATQDGSCVKLNAARDHGTQAERTAMGEAMAAAMLNQGMTDATNNDYQLLATLCEHYTSGNIWAAAGIVKKGK